MLKLKLERGEKLHKGERYEKQMKQVIGKG